MRNTVDIRFAASEPATNKALQEVRVLGGFGLFGVPCGIPRLSCRASPLFDQESSQAMGRLDKMTVFPRFVNEMRLGEGEGVAKKVSHSVFRIFGGAVSTEQARFENTHGKLCAEGLNG
jgi:hypothetical protein